MHWTHQPPTHCPNARQTGTNIHRSQTRDSPNLASPASATIQRIPSDVKHKASSFTDHNSQLPLLFLQPCTINWNSHTARCLDSLPQTDSMPRGFIARNNKINRLNCITYTSIVQQSRSNAIKHQLTASTSKAMGTPRTGKHQRRLSF